MSSDQDIVNQNWMSSIVPATRHPVRPCLVATCKQLNQMAQLKRKPAQALWQQANQACLTGTALSAALWQQANHACLTGTTETAAGHN